MKSCSLFVSGERFLFPLPISGVVTSLAHVIVKARRTATLAWCRNIRIRQMASMTIGTCHLDCSYTCRRRKGICLVSAKRHLWILQWRAATTTAAARVCEAVCRGGRRREARDGL